MDPTSHIPSVTLFYYLISVIPLTGADLLHLENCAQCQDLVDEFKTYIDPDMIRAA
jgi:hypothetical protein